MNNLSQSKQALQDLEILPQPFSQSNDVFHTIVTGNVNKCSGYFKSVSDRDILLSFLYFLLPQPDMPADISSHCNHNLSIV